MPDVYANIVKVDRAIQERLADVIELRAADPSYRLMLETYFAQLRFPQNARVLEVGCGTGPITRALARRNDVAQAVGVDPSSVFVARARELARETSNVSFDQGDGRALQFEAGSFDAVVMHTTLCHVPGPEEFLAEAWRVLRPGGQLVVFDGDYATATVATGAFDPLEMCMHAFRENFVHDPWLVRRLPELIKAKGFHLTAVRSHGYLEAPRGGYMLTWIDRGADALAQTGRIAKETAEAFKAEARRRNDQEAWFGHIAFASVVGAKPTRTPDSL